MFVSTELTLLMENGDRIVFKTHHKSVEEAQKYATSVQHMLRTILSMKKSFDGVNFKIDKVGTIKSTEDDTTFNVSGKLISGNIEVIYPNYVQSNHRQLLESLDKNPMMDAIHEDFGID